MKVEKKLAILKKAYGLYEEFIARHDLVCEEYCSSCCTCNVTATTLEGYYIHQNLVEKKQGAELKKVYQAPPARFTPALTFNRIAELCMRGEKIPEEKCDPSIGQCPFLEQGLCNFYSYRPFGCRCMCSSKVCSETGFAEMPPLVMTVNDIFMQFIEHIDAGGFSGNLTDVLVWISDRKNRRRYEKGAPVDAPQGLVPNIPIPVWMAPPEHVKQIESLAIALKELISS